ncbi:hypothetical protein J6R97_04995 [bacterium]|nr:hypothetical protein [bacterium]
MDKDTFLSKITEIGTCEDQAQRNSLLVGLSDDMGTVFDNFANTSSQITTLNEEINKYKEDITALQRYNMELFKKIDAQKSQAEQIKDSTGIEQPESNNKRKFEDLFKPEA